MAGLLIHILESFLGDARKHDEDTGQASFDCPACSAEAGKPEGDGKGNLEINYNRSIFKCWACADVNGMHGVIMRLLKKYATPKNIRDYLLVKPDADTITRLEKEAVIVTLPEGFKPLSECTQKDYKYGEAMWYLRNRGITDEIIKYYNIGYTTKGDFFNRIIIPSYDAYGELNYFVARWFSSKYNKLKYLNPTAVKEDITFGEDKLNYDATIYLVEGAFDHIVVPNSIALLGKYVPDRLLEMLHDNANAFIVILLDDDAYNDAMLLYRKLNFGNLTGRIRIIRPRAGFDPSKIFEQQEGSKGVTALLRTSYCLPDF
jgi:hypothetical protein